MSAFQYIAGRAYKKSLLEKAEFWTKQEAMTLFQAKKLYVDALDYGFITQIEQETLLYIADHYKMETDAQKWIKNRMNQETPTQRAIKRTIWEAYELQGMNWIVDEEELNQQSKLVNGGVPFTEALFEMLHSFLHQMESSESPRDILSLVKEVDLEDREATTKALRESMKNGAIYLFPSNYKEVIEMHKLPFNASDLVRDFEKNWMFGFITPDLPNWYFIGFVNRSDSSDTYNMGFKRR